MVTKEEILAVARLAKLYVPDDEAEEITSEMNRIISFADTIQRASPKHTEFDCISGLCNVMRDDTEIPSFPRDKILENTACEKDGYFLLRRHSDD